ncbi:MAG: hypothetical protein IID16_07740 [Candidatus Marinimicrobia bacterium]|nr:hypothetical protein [Candidatus Neomarinimicrobiota bacterium]
MDKNELLRRTRQFAIRVFKVVEKFPGSKAADVPVCPVCRQADDRQGGISTLESVIFSGCQLQGC